MSSLKDLKLEHIQRWFSEIVKGNCEKKVLPSCPVSICPVSIFDVARCQSDGSDAEKYLLGGLEHVFPYVYIYI